VGLLERIDRAVGRLNRWFGGAAVASGAQPQNRSVNTIAVKTVLGEIEHGTSAEADEAEDGRPDPD
jgi:hypothetical protein